MSNPIYSINLIPGRSAPAVVHVSQGDIRRLLIFDIIDGTDVTDWAATGYTFAVRGTKPSGLGFEVEGTVVRDENGTTIRFRTTKNMTSESGRIPAEIRVTDESTGEILGTGNFILQVEKNPHLPGTVDGSEDEAQSIMDQVRLLAQEVTSLAEQAEAAVTEAQAQAEQAAAAAAMAMSGTPEGYEALVEKVAGIPGNVDTKISILRRKILALTAGVKDHSRWPLRTYYEVTKIEDNIVTFRFAGRLCSFNMNVETPGNYGLITYLYGYSFLLPLFYKDRTVSNPSTIICFDGRKKTIDDVHVGDVASTITVYKRFKEGRYLVLKMDATGMHVRMLYDYAPDTLSSLYNPDTESPYFNRVFYQVGIEAVEVNEVPTGRVLTTVQSADWKAGEWHTVNILW